MNNVALRIYLENKRKLKSLIIVCASGAVAFAGICLYKGEEKFYKNYVMPLVHLLDAEKAHKLAIFASKYHLIPKIRYKDPDLLKVSLFGKTFPNPIGIAAGFDKNGEAVVGLKDLGFGFVEIGSVTPEPQPGNEKPRVFRLLQDSAVINRYGFNSDGHDTVLKRIYNLKERQFSGIVGVNLGKNKISQNPIDDYVQGVNKFGPACDYLVINISSPNTLGLRDMQRKETLPELLNAVIKARDNLPNYVPILLKLAPDMDENQRKDIASIVQKSKIDGLIICNTTIERPEFLVNKINEAGGLSGKPLKKMSTEMIKEMYKLTKGKIPIIGVGGVFSGQDAYEKIKAGATVVQLYTAMIYEGPLIAAKVKRELEELLRRDGYKSVADAVGKDAK